MEPLAKATIIEGVAATAHRDSQGEILDLDGADITPLLEGKGFVNSDHSQTFAHLVGRVVGAKKITKLADCETPAQIKYFNDMRHPFIWTKLELWDGVGHKEADAIGSIYKFYKEKGEDAPIKLSVEGKTLERQGRGILKRTLIKGVAITVRPANAATKTDVVQIVKSMGGNESLIKSDIGPDFVEITGDPWEKILDLAMTANDLLKNINGVGDSGVLKCQKALLNLKNLIIKAQA